MRQQRTPVWDLPTRIFHWSIVACVLLSWWSAETDNYTVHEWTGYTVIVLVATRIVWGFLGSRHSRFADFLVGPRRILAYLRGCGAASAGHNPLGGWSVVAMLVLLLIQAVSGLFNSDDVLFSGPLHHMAETGFRDTMGVVHDVVFNLLLAVIALHVSAVFYHQLRLREKLVQAMVRGSAPEREGRAQPAPAWRALAIAVLLALALWWGLEQAPQPQQTWW
ncbi:MAG: cytochrome b/b6 domain-containing protein [Halioglobus sp.]|nr:cytochrome b/b6 domain-containing protein [Halioglobus sp.]